MFDKDPIREALEEILKMAKGEKAQPLFAKLEAKKPKVVIETSTTETAEPVKEEIEEKEDDVEIDDETLQKIKALLA